MESYVVHLLAAGVAEVVLELVFNLSDGLWFEVEELEQVGLVGQKLEQFGYAWQHADVLYLNARAHQEKQSKHG
jgi:hypothetical protein